LKVLAEYFILQSQKWVLSMIVWGSKELIYTVVLLGLRRKWGWAHAVSHRWILAGGPELVD
jgi:hypothetical protein